MKKKIVISGVVLIVVIAITIALILIFTGNEIETGEQVTDRMFYDNSVNYSSPEELVEKYPDYDFDGDGLSNKKEVELGTREDKADTDGDGLNDGFEVNKSNTDPTKWSSRDDGMSDLDYYVINGSDFEEGYYGDVSGYAIYLAKKEDRIYRINKYETTAFDEMYTVSDVYQILDFTGKMALNCSKYAKEVANEIKIYKLVDGVAVKVDSIVTDINVVEFEVTSGDVFCAVYEP